MQLVVEKDQGSGCPVWGLWEEGGSGSWVVLWGFLLRTLGDRILRRCNKTWLPFIAVEFPQGEDLYMCVLLNLPFYSGVGRGVHSALGCWSWQWTELTTSSLRAKTPENCQHRLNSIHSMLGFSSLLCSRNLSPAGSTEHVMGMLPLGGWFLMAESACDHSWNKLLLFLLLPCQIP